MNRVTLLIVLLGVVVLVLARRGDRFDSDQIGFHLAVTDSSGALLPWLPVQDVLDLQFKWYFSCPRDSHGFPHYFTNTFVNGSCQPDGFAVLPGMLGGFGILSYVKYAAYRQATNPVFSVAALAYANHMADYLLNYTLTPASHKYGLFPRSTGLNLEFPLTCAAQGDLVYGCNTIEPDKGAIIAYALLQLHKVTPHAEYLASAMHIADVLVSNLDSSADSTRSPLPFRVDSVTGFAFETRSANMVYVALLLDTLVDEFGLAQFAASRAALVRWIVTYQLTAPTDPASSLWCSFFEVHEVVFCVLCDVLLTKEGVQDKLDPNDRVSWVALETASYLCQRRESADPAWRTHVLAIFNYTLSNFGRAVPEWDVTLMGEQVGFAAVC
jgi:hypothetical protein